MISLQDTQDFKANRIPTFDRGEEEYERAVATPNLLFRFSRPDIVLQPESPWHVQKIIEQARASGLKLTIKCGGHSYAGHSTAFEGILLDLRRMNRAKLDMSTKTITFEAGCQWGHVYKTLINGRHDGFVINGGRCPFVGVSGFLLGGGLGPFSRSIGMGCDTIEEIKIVTAEAELVTVKRTDDPTSDKGRLFWALCGAGGGNFGVVVEMKVAVPKLQGPGGVVVAGRYQWFASKDNPDLFEQADFMSTMNKFYTTDWPERITIDSTWICDLRQSTGNGVRFLTYFDGDKYDFDATIDQYVTHTGLATQLKRRSLPEKSTRFLHETLVAQWSEETVKAFPTNKSYSIYSSFVFRNDASTIEQVTAIIRAKAILFRESFPGERVEFLATFIHSGGKMSTPKPTDSAFFWREAVYHMYLTVEWEDKWMELDMRKFLGDAKSILRPLSLQGNAAFVNFPDGALESDISERAYWGDNREELRRVKELWDKSNFFWYEQGIGPPGGSQPTGLSSKIQPYSAIQPYSEMQVNSAIQVDSWTGIQPNSLTAALGIQPKSAIRRISEWQAEKSGDQGNDESLTDSLAAKQWEVYDPGMDGGIW